MAKRIKRDHKLPGMNAFNKMTEREYEFLKEQTKSKILDYVYRNYVDHKYSDFEDQEQRNYRDNTVFFKKMKRGDRKKKRQSAIGLPNLPQIKKGVNGSSTNLYIKWYDYSSGKSENNTTHIPNDYKYKPSVDIRGSNYWWLEHPNSLKIAEIVLNTFEKQVSDRATLRYMDEVSYGEREDFTKDLTRNFLKIHDILFTKQERKALLLIQELRKNNFKDLPEVFDKISGMAAKLKQPVKQTQTVKK